MNESFFFKSLFLLFSQQILKSQWINQNKAPVTPLPDNTQIAEEQTLAKRF